MSERGRDVHVAPWTGTWADDDKDANFKADVALYAHADPLSTLDVLGDNIGVPVGGLVHYVLSRWASAGSAALLEMGPSMVERMWEQVRDAETDADKLRAFDALAKMISWLRVPLADA